jgi:YVTN family beta-propeller protein
MRYRSTLALSALAISGGLVLATIAPMSADAATSTYAVSATVAVGSFANGVAVDAATNTTYVTNAGDDTVSVIDGTTNTVTDTIAVGSLPYSAALDAVTDRLYVTNAQANTVSVIDTTNDMVISTINVGNFPIFAVVNPVTNTVYVANQSDSTVSIINGATNSVTSLPVAPYPYSVGVDTQTNTLYVPSQVNGSVTAINATTLSVIATIGVGAFPDWVVVNSTTHTVYVDNSEDNSLSVINGTTNTASAPIPLAARASALAVDQTSNSIFVAGADSALDVIDGSTNTVTSTTQIPATCTTGPDLPECTQPAGIAVDPLTNTLYLSNSGLRSGSSLLVLTATTAPTISTTTLPGGRVGTGYTSQVQATGSSPITFAVSAGTLPDGLTLDAATGALTGTPTTAGRASFTITATNAIGTDSQAYTVLIAAAMVAPSITSTSLPAATVGDAYAATVHSSGTAPVTFAVTGGALPDGLSLNSATGVISGTPTTADAASFTVRATNAGGSDSQAFVLTVRAAAVATVTVTFNTEGHGTAPAAQTFPSGSTATEPTAPAAKGLEFIGWYTTPDLTTRVNFADPVTHDETLYAGFSALAFTGVDLSPWALPAGAGVLILGILFVAASYRRKRRSAK